MERTLKDRIVMITGAATGIGAGIAQKFAQHGARVVVADLDAERAAATARDLGPEHFSIPLDVASDESWTEAMAEVAASAGALGVLVNCAGINPVGNVMSISLENWRRTLAVNLEGVFLGCRHAIPAIARAGGGAIINIASPVGQKPTAALIAYGASKAGVLNLTKSVALHCAAERNGIRCNAIIPGAVHTEMTERFLRTTADYQRTLENISSGRPLGRLGTPEDIGKAAVFLASDDAAFITGESLAVDGGALLV